MSFLFEVALTFKISIILGGLYYRCDAQKNQDKLSFYVWSIGQNYNKIWNPAPIFSGKKLMCLEKEPVGGCSVYSLQVESMFMVAHDGESKDDFFVSSRVYCFVSVSVGGTSLACT